MNSLVIFFVLLLGADQPTFRFYLERARKLAQEGSLQQAAADYSEAIRLRLDNADAWMGRGKARIGLGRYRDAIDDFDQVLRLRPGFVDATLERAFAFGQAGDFSSAVNDFTRVLRAQPSNARALKLRGAAYWEMEQLPRAIDDLSAALRLEPDDAQLFLTRAEIYTAQERFSSALADRSEAVRLLPQSAEARLARGGSYHALGMHDQGLADRSDAIRLKPELAEAWCARGSAYFLLGDYAKALGDLEQALRLKPGYQEASMVLDKTRAEIAKSATVEIGTAVAPTESTAPVAIAVDVRGPDIIASPPAPAGAPPLPIAPAPKAAKAPDLKAAQVHNQHGRELLYQGKYQEAVVELSAALLEKPDFTRALNARGFAYQLLRDWPHALEDLDAAIRLDPRYVNAYHNRSVTRKAAGDIAGSAADDAKVAELSKK